MERCASIPEGPLAYVPVELRSMVAEQLQRVDELQRNPGRVIQFVFPHLAGPHCGDRIVEFRKRGGAPPAPLAYPDCTTTISLGRPQHETQRRCSFGRHENHRAQNPVGLSPLRNRERRGRAGSRPEDGCAADSARHTFWHTGARRGKVR